MDRRVGFTDDTGGPLEMISRYALRDCYWQTGFLPGGHHTPISRASTTPIMIPLYHLIFISSTFHIHPSLSIPSIKAYPYAP
jgi:hypothetical protein